MKHLCFSLLLTIVAQPAIALSCLQPTIEQAFLDARDAQEIYVPVLGRFEGFARRPEPKDNRPEDRSFTARFVGQAVTTRVIGPRIDVTVQVNENCIASWCPAVVPGVEMLTFLEKSGEDYIFNINACGGNAFANPTRETVNQLRTCLRDMDCAPPEF